MSAFSLNDSVTAKPTRPKPPKDFWYRNPWNWDTEKQEFSKN